MAVRAFRVLKIAVLAVVLAYWAWNYASGQRELSRARKEWATLAARKQALLGEVARLRREVESLERETESRSRAARELLGVCGEQEKVVILPRR